MRGMGRDEVFPKASPVSLGIQHSGLSTLVPKPSGCRQVPFPTGIMWEMQAFSNKPYAQMIH